MMRLTGILLGALTGAALMAGCGGDDDVRSVADVASTHLEAHPALLYARVTTVDGETYRGRLRFGGGEEAFWGDYFNGRKNENPWIAHMPRRERPRQGIRLLGLRVGADGAAVDRPFMARMGDIAKLEASGRHLWVTMKSGTVHHLDRYAADDFADGVRIWDAEHGMVELNERRVRTIEFEAPSHATADTPHRLHGTVRTSQGVFTGFIQWGRESSLAMDELEGRTQAGDRMRVPFATVRSITRASRESANVTLLDGRQVLLSESGYAAASQRGVFVDDVRYGRVLVSWNALDRADFTPVGAYTGDSGPAYGDFAAGRALAGTVTTGNGRRLTGRIVFDLDESESTETLDAPAGGVDYTLPLELVASIVLAGGGEGSGHAGVLLRSGETLQLERSGDLGGQHGGVLVFEREGEPAEYVPWRDVARLDFRAE